MNPLQKSLLCLSAALLITPATLACSGKTCWKPDTIFGQQTTRRPDCSIALSPQQGQLICIGNQMRLILPADTYFAPYGTDLNPDAYRPLLRVASWLRQFPDEHITVAGYSDDVAGNLKQTEQMTEKQAARIAGFLWRHGVPSKNISILGIGQEGDYTVANNTSNAAYYANRRVEITLRETHAPAY